MARNKSCYVQVRTCYMLALAQGNKSHAVSLDFSYSVASTLMQFSLFGFCFVLSFGCCIFDGSFKEMAWTEHFGLCPETHQAHWVSPVYFWTLGVCDICVRFWEDIISPRLSNQDSAVKVCLFLYWLTFVRWRRQNHSVLLCRMYSCFLQLLVLRMETLWELWHRRKLLSRPLCIVQLGFLQCLGPLLRLTLWFAQRVL